MEKVLSVILSLALFISSVTESALSESQADGAPISQTVTVSPGHDFYMYANSEPFTGRWGPTLAQSSEEIVKQLKTLSEIAAIKKAPKGSDEQLIGDFWFTGMDAETLNRDGLAPLKPYLDRIDKINSTQDMMDVIADLNMDTREETFLFSWIVWRDDNNSQRLVLRLSPGGFTGPALYPPSDPNGERVWNAFRTYLVRSFTRLHGDENKARTSASDVSELAVRMRKAEATQDSFRAVTPSELSAIAPAIDWSRYFEKIGLRSTDAVVMQGAGYFRNLDEMIRTVPLSTWKDFLRLRLLRANVAFLDDRTLDDFFQYDRMFTGADRPRDRWQRVVRHVGSRLGQPMTRLYFKAHDLGPVKAHYQAISERFRASFRTRIENLDWMTPETKASARKKLDSMIMTIGYRGDFRTDFRKMDVRRDHYVRNMMRANRWLNEREIARVGSIVERTDSGLGGMERGDAAYNGQNNEAILPVEFFVTGKGLDEAVVYARLASLGHEMSHGFDNNGRQRNETGNKANWWTEADSSAFNLRTKVLVDIYNEFAPIEGLRVNGQRTLNENLSDLTGLLIALDAYKQTDQFKKNETVNGFKPLQRFFLAWANRDRRKLQTKEDIAGLLQFGVHSPDKLRVNGTLMNVPEFYQAFDIKPGDPMYRPESKRARVW